MVTHVVLIHPRPGVSAMRFAELTERLCDLTETVTGQAAHAVGPNMSEEELDQGFRFGFVLRFASRGALDAYHVHPAHLAISLMIRDLAERILVFDVAN